MSSNKKLIIFSYLQELASAAKGYADGAVSAAASAALAAIEEVASQKADKTAATTSTAGLMSAGDKTKLNGISTGANNYTHPSSHAATMITEDTTHRFVTDSEKTIWNNKASTAAATTSTAGLMSKEDKTKLNGFLYKFGTDNIGIYMEEL